MNILVWPGRRSWTDAFVQGRHRYLLPALFGRGGEGNGSGPSRWPSSVVTVSGAQLAEEQIDVVVLQRPEEFGLAASWLRRVPGRDVAAVYVEHDPPPGPAVSCRHPAADRDDLVLVHVTHFNSLMWDSGRTRTVVVEPGVLDPGRQYSGLLTAAAAVLDDPARRPRALGADLLPAIGAEVPLHVFGAGTEQLTTDHGPSVLGLGAHPVERLHTELARRRAYLQLSRWTSLDPTLIEAMQLGMPVVVLGTAEAVEAVPPSVGVCSTDPARLARALVELAADPDLARRRGRAARRYALDRYGLHRFLAGWQRVLEELPIRRPVRPAAAHQKVTS